jgi:hypothetical protein
MEHTAPAPGAGWRARVKHGWERVEPLLRRLASAPLLIAVVTAVGAFAVQWIARSWQNREHEHELKGALVTEMSDAYTSPVLTAQSIATGVLVKRIKDPTEIRVAANTAYDNGLRSWRLASARVGSEIEAHFPTVVKEQWDDYSVSVTDLYRLSATGFETADRSEWVTKVRDQIGGSDTTIRWKVIVAGVHEEKPFRVAFVNASEALLARGDYLLQSVLAHRARNL